MSASQISCKIRFSPPSDEIVQKVILLFVLDHFDALLLKFSHNGEGTESDFIHRSSFLALLLYLDGKVDEGQGGASLSPSKDTVYKYSFDRRFFLLAQNLS